MAERKQVIVSNRLPVQPVRTDNGWIARPSAGGLVSALSAVKDDTPFEWIGWAGADVEDADRPQVTAMFREQYHAHPVFLTARQIDRFYNGFCNSVIWPLFHYTPTRVDFSLPYWDEYRRVNEIFADAVIDSCSEDDLVWVHDFHLFLVPQLLRARRPKQRIGFFLHIPFPSSEIYRLLPVRKEILLGILGSDLIGFQTPDYSRHFATTCRRILGLATGVANLTYDGRRVAFGSYPIGINPALFRTALRSPACAAQRARLEDSYRGLRVIVGVDRLDYSKGLELKLGAFARFLEKYPSWVGKVVLVQVAVPSRTQVPFYRRLKNDVDRIVGEVNGRFGSASYAPIQYIAHDESFDELCALYERADACLVTSVRDGMNLVALEYTVCQYERHGVLILSEFCGAASSMGSALVVNPWDRDGVADAIHQALTMPEEERIRRGASNYRYANNFNSRAWARRFVRDLAAGTAAESPLAEDLRQQYFTLRSQFRRADRRVFFLDYDGTLVDFKEDPGAAAPSGALLDLIRQLAGDPRNAVYIISGRERAELERWFAGIPVAMAAEHGTYFRARGSTEWYQRELPPLDWMPTVRSILNDFAKRTPGARVEQKSTSVAWHYRGVEESFGERQSLELMTHLEETLANVPVGVLQGSMVIEVRPQMIHKGRLVDEVLREYAERPDFVLCMGDDRTDEDMFLALTGSAWTCRIGERVTHARYYLPSPEDVLDILADLAGLEE